MNAKFARIHNSDGSCNFIFNVISANGNEHKILDKLQDGEMQEIYFPSKPINEKQGSGYQPKEIVIDSIPPQDGSGVPSKHNNIIEQLTLALSRIEAAEALINSAIRENCIKDESNFTHCTEWSTWQSTIRAMEGK